MGREGQDREAGFQDGGKGLEAVGDTRQYYIGLRGLKDFEVAWFIEGPTVVEDGEVVGGELGEEFEASIWCRRRGCRGGRGTGG